MKRLCCVLASVLMLWGLSVGTVYAEETTAFTEAVVSEEDADAGKAGKIVGFLAIFTVVCGTTAYLVMRPSLKRLKEAKKASDPAEKQNEKE